MTNLKQIDMKKKPKLKAGVGQAEGALKTVGLIAMMGELFADTQKDKNDWKLRMLKAGISGLSIPEDWDTLTEAEKTRRLDAVIKLTK